MKKGHDIKEVVQKINNDVQYKKDYIVTLNALQINKSEKVFPNVQITDSPTQYNLTDHSLNQLCGRLEIGTHYINKCLPVSQDLVAHNLNFWINKTKSHLGKIGVKSEIHLGIAGPAKLTTILKYAKICGVSATTSVFMKQGLDIRKIINHNPDNILNSLIGYDKLHIYPFGGINEFLKWYKNTNIKEVF